jgi:hypothetical protein
VYVEVIEQGTDEVLARYGNSAWNGNINESNGGCTLVQYKADLSAFMGKNVYFRITDQGENNYGLFFADSFITYYESAPEAGVEAENLLYRPVNGGFESGDLSGWTESGENIGVVTDASGWWNENLPYNKEGNFLYSGIACEGNQGTLTSTSFIVGGSGFMTFRLGGGGNSDLCYVSVVDAETNKELARFANSEFNDQGIDTINQGSNLANMVLYKADLSAILGRKVKIVVTDNATSDWGLITVDDFVTYYASEPETGVKAENLLQVKNGGFESGDLTGWTLDGEIGYVSSQNTFFSGEIYNKDGEYLFTGVEDVNGGFEGNQGTLTSSNFILGGCGYITFKLGGGGNEECYILIKDATTGETLAKYHNDHLIDGYMMQYVADLSEYLGRTVYIQVVDYASNDWGCMAVDSFVTYYENVNELPEVNGENVFAAVDIK